ncbi:calnexin-like isoform X1 [Haliotis rufescens]|uniref:calnexin-like isoform X1 n=1 Tax=Haliotis rufescens TaxID=6454 RepID=UPI001EB00EE2|nr:calnexin-like isoform X1 [Haliotis rufescens]
MKLLRSLLLVTLLGLLLIQLVHCEEAVEDEDEEDDDGTVEEEDDTTEEPREKPHYKKPELKGSQFFVEPFDNKADSMKRWVPSQAKKGGVEEDLAKYDGKWSFEEPKESPLIGDLGLILTSRAKHHAISAHLNKPFVFRDKPLIAQYEVRFQNGMDCGGAYVKLLSQQQNLDLKAFHDKTPYTIMFGPDKCGLDHKLHFIFRHKNPKTGEVEEKHAKKPSGNLDSYFTDKKTHLFTLVVNPDNSFEFLIDNTVVNQGSLLEDVSPPVNPPKEIEDPNDKKPADWDEREKIPDPDASKPDDWDESEPEMIPDPDGVKPDGWLDDEPLLVPDPAADKPEDWDDDMDGEWEAPLVDNPKCKEAAGCGDWHPENIKNPNHKGKWSAPMIDNPSYKGIWKPQVIPNPNYFEDVQPFKMTPISAVGLELWSMSDGIVFDNFLITDDRLVAEQYAEQTWVLKNIEEKASSSSGGFWTTLKSAADDRPWLWAVYVVVLLMPIVLLSICLCPKSGPVKPEDIDAQRKKTDEPSPDDEEEKEDTTESSGDKKSVGPGGDNKGKTSKSDLNAAADEEDDGDDDDDEDADEEGESDEVKEENKSSSPKKSPRRRKARKE